MLFLGKHLQFLLLFALLVLVFLGLCINIMFKRSDIAAISLSASALVAIALHEGYKENAYLPLAGDVPTIGFGTTTGVKLGDKTSPEKALQAALRDIQKFEGALKQCVKVPLTQGEYDVYISLSYNIGSSNCCRSSLVKKLHAGDYAGACEAISSWVYFKGKKLPGLVKRREIERAKCEGKESDKF
jgi:lysozyme